MQDAFQLAFVPLKATGCAAVEKVILRIVDVERESRKQAEKIRHATDCMRKWWRGSIP